MRESPASIPYSSIARHGVIGDRRTAALVAADGTLDWLCLPDYDGLPLFAALLDVDRGGSWRLGPPALLQGEQHYLDDTPVLVTRWQLPSGDLELLDAMLWPERDRPADRGSARTVLRRLRCTRGTAPFIADFDPRADFGPTAALRKQDGTLSGTVGAQPIRLWIWGAPLPEDEARLTGELQEGETLWAVLQAGGEEPPWSVARAEATLAETIAYWQRWGAGLDCGHEWPQELGRSALLIHLLSYAPAGSLVAAPTTSLPERIGASRNWDYRYAWVRDASLSMAVLAMLGDPGSAGRYMDWLEGLCSSSPMPLQVVYGIHGEHDLPQHERDDLSGYRGSRPVRTGNRACGQRQLDSLGYLADCAWIYLQHGAPWHERYWSMIERAAHYTAAHWQEPGSGIWEMPEQQQFVSSKVMSWVVLDRAIRIAEQTGHGEATDHWRQVASRIHQEVCERGWSERLGAFRQRYGAEALDASALLIPLNGFLPHDDPRVVATVRRIEAELTIDGLVYRYDPRRTPGHASGPPLGAFEGAFLPCTFWLATVQAQQGRAAEAKATLERVRAAFPLGLFAEELDTREGTALGNFPLLFSQVEYARALLALRTHRSEPRNGKGD